MVIFRFYLKEMIILNCLNRVHDVQNGETSELTKMKQLSRFSSIIRNHIQDFPFFFFREISKIFRSYSKKHSSIFEENNLPIPNPFSYTKAKRGDGAHFGHRSARKKAPINLLIFFTLEMSTI